MRFLSFTILCFFVPWTASISLSPWYLLVALGIFSMVLEVEILIQRELDVVEMDA